VSCYCYLFGRRGAAFRFANVVGARQTHGGVYDLIRKLRADPTRLEVLGDGSQSKSYIHVDDVLNAILSLVADPPDAFDVFNVGTGDYVTVREIASMVVAEMGLSNVEMKFGSEARGWKGDVPVVRFSSDKILARGWKNRYSSREALADSIRSLIRDAEHST
jgi:UDP-glucose 4-epimerase